MIDRHPEPEYMDDPAEASAYAAADFAEVNAAFVARLLELTRDIERAHAVDLGTGPGDIALRVARARPSWRIIAIDGSEPMLTIARQRGEGMMNLSFVQRDAKATGITNGSCDLVFSNSLLHHLPDPVSLWREIRRIARSGSVVFLRDLMRPTTEDDARRIVQTYAGSESTLLQEEFYRSLLSAFTMEEIRAQLGACGLETLSVQPASDRHVDIFGQVSPQT